MAYRLHVAYRIGQDTTEPLRTHRQTLLLLFLRFSYSKRMCFVLLRLRYKICNATLSHITHNGMVKSYMPKLEMGRRYIFIIVRYRYYDIDIRCFASQTTAFCRNGLLILFAPIPYGILISVSEILLSSVHYRSHEILMRKMGHASSHLQYAALLEQFDKTRFHVTAAIA